MAQVKKTMVEGFADGSELFAFYTGIAQDIAKIPLLTDAGVVFTASSGGTIALSSGHTVRPAAGDLLILTTGTSTDPGKGAAIVLAGSSANTYVVPTTHLGSGIFSTSAVQGYLVRFSVLGSAVTTTT
jgi:hypothetical protein